MKSKTAKLSREGRAPSLEAILDYALTHCRTLSIKHPNKAASARWFRRTVALSDLRDQARRGTLVMIPNPVLTGRGRGRKAVDSPLSPQSSSLST